MHKLLAKLTDPIPDSSFEGVCEYLLHLVCPDEMVRFHP